MDQSAIHKFNMKESGAWELLYSMLYRELYYYSSTLYSKLNIDPDDAIQDAFVDVWCSDDIQFSSVEKLRNYLYVIIKHKFINQYNRAVRKNKIDKEIKFDSDFFIVQAVEGELYSILPEALSLLPEECARTFKLFLEGFEIGEIAEMLNKKQSTIYNQRKQAISILKRKLDKDKFFTILILLSRGI